MYTEENARGRFPLRDILLKGLVVIIFIFLISFIITKVTSSNKADNKPKTSSYDKTFSENLKTMEEAALKYYTKDKLPKEVLDSKKVTLRELINSNTIEAFTDANGKSCDVNKSYIRLTKNEDDYTLRVNLECNNKKDYSLMKVNEYDYCKYDICRKDSSKEVKEDKTKKKTKDEKKVKITETTETTTNKNIPSSADNNHNENTNTNNNNNNNNNSNNVPITRTYEYKKVTSPVLSEWSSWSEWVLNNNRISAIKCGDTDANCLKEIQLYSQIEIIGVDKNNKPVSGRVHYYSYRTRTLVSSGSIDIKWSTYNDNNLLGQGYTYTGNFK